MRILKVRFKNLNSLAGEWSIDFTDPEYLSHGIFAITGPTGSGKTTILDAICLALYGETPRLGKITKSANEIMSRQCGECFSEVEFETAKGRFRCHFSQRRAYGRTGGELQNPKHEIVDAVNDQVLESKLREVIARVIEVTGMDFDRFTRSILLAQGGFSKFLLAKAGDRAPILEKITGTEIYSRISMKVHEQMTEQRRILEMMTAELEGMHLLTDEEKKNCKQDLERLSEQVFASGRELEVLNGSITWHEAIAALEKERTMLEKATVDFIRKKEESEVALQRLGRAEKAFGLEPDFVNLSSAREQQKKEQGLLEEKSTLVPVLENNLQVAAVKLDDLEGAVKLAEGNRRQEAGLIVRVRELDTRCFERERQMNDQVTELKAEKGKCAEIEKNLLLYDQETAELKKNLQQVNDYLKQWAADAELVERLEAVRHQVSALAVVNEEKKNGEKELIGISESRTRLEQDLKKREKIFLNDQVKAGNVKLSLERLQQELETLLGGNNPSDLRRETTALEKRLHDLNALASCFGEISKAERLRRELDVRRSGLEKRCGELSAEEKTVTERLTSGREIMEHLLDKRELARRILSLEEQRSRLEDHQPCPLCGSLEHPFAGANLPKVDVIEEELGQAKQQVDTLQKELTGCQVAKARATGDLTQCIRDMDRIAGEKAEQESREAKLLELTGVAGTLPEEPEHRISHLAAEIEREHTVVAGNMNVLLKVDKLSEEEKKLQKDLSIAQEAERKSGAIRDGLVREHEIAVKEGMRMTEFVQTKTEQLEQGEKILGDSLKRYGIERFGLQESESLLKSLEKRRELWKKKQKEKELLEKQLVILENKAGTSSLLLEKLIGGMRRNRNRLKEASLELHRKRSERRSLYGSKDPAVEEQRLSETVKSAVVRRDELKNRINEQERQLHGVKVEVNGLRSSTATRSEIIRQLESRWIERLQSVGFPTEGDFIDARLDHHEIQALQALRDGLNREQIELTAAGRNVMEKLELEKRKNVTDRSRESLVETRDQIRKSLDEVQQVIGGIKARMEQDGKNREQQQEKIKALEKQDREYKRWEHLHGLIGSSDGKKFRMFAQGLTFELMISHANRKLRDMNDRYILIRDAQEPLELGVIDNYQAGEIRSTKNLSGGESFIVSLALALGLSNMASRNVRVDSLFLDEGFGTLDEDALETALETLAGLHQDSKLIGVISHVPALKERILTRIRVIPGAGGRSRLDGPGCMEH